MVLDIIMKNIQLFKTTNMDPQEYQWLDVTEEILGIKSEMKLLELIKDDEITLQECMQAQEIDDDKMDPKFDITHQNTIHYKLKEKMVKLPSSLTPKQINQILVNVFQIEAAALKGYPLSTSIYKFAYLYDPTITSDDLVMEALSRSVETLGRHIYKIIKQSCSIKEDDVNISVFSFTKKAKTHEEVIELLIQAQKKIELLLKNSGDQKCFLQHIVLCLRVRRFLHLFAKSSDIQFDPKNMKKIISDIQSARKRLVQLQEAEYKGEQTLLEGVFFDDLNKTIRAHFGPRQSPVIAFKDSLVQVRNIFEQFELFLPIPNKISQIFSRIAALEAKTVNSWPRSYLKVGIFAKDDYIFSHFKTEDLFIEDINDWVHLKEDVKSNEKFKQLIKNGAPVISEILYRLLGNSMRWHWENSKIYGDFNILVHMASEVDKQLSTVNKEMLVCSWFYYYGVNLMIRQLLVGFQINLYEVSEIKYILYVLEGLLVVMERNSQVHLRKIDKSLAPNFLQGNLNKKMKKKMSDNGKKMFADVFFKKGLANYFRALFFLVSVLQNRKIIENRFEQNEEIRIKNRFRIFKQVMFVKVIEYEEYRTVLEKIAIKESEFLAQALDSLKQSKNIFQLFVNQFDHNQTYFRQKEDAELLMKLSVKASLAAMSLRMGAPNKKYTIDLSERFPDINVK